MQEKELIIKGNKVKANVPDSWLVKKRGEEFLKNLGQGKSMVEEERFIEDAIPKYIKDELKHFHKTKVPRCLYCKKNFKRVNEHTWKSDCKCAKRDIRVMIG